MSNYENAPATKILATNCCCCGKPLVDAASVELGIGPVCRKKYYAGVEVDDAARVKANAIIYALAAAVTAGATVEDFDRCKELAALGFERIAQIFTLRVVAVTVEERDGQYYVRNPYSPDFNYDAWTKTRYGVKVPVEGAPTKRKVFHWVYTADAYARTKIWRAIVKHFDGQLALFNGEPRVIAPLKTAAQKRAEWKAAQKAA